MAITSLSSPLSASVAAAGAWPGARVVFIVLTLAFAGAVVAAFALSVERWTPAAIVAIPLVAASALWIAGGAATAILGLLPLAPGPRISLRAPSGRTAVLVMICREEPAPVAAATAALHAGLAREGLGQATRVFVLSDTRGEAGIAAEEAAFAPLVAAGAVTYRRRPVNTGLKPGNIADWLDRWGDSYDHMLVLDADSRMSAARVGRMIARMEARPRLGLLQAAIGLAPGRTGFGRHQRNSARLLGPAFVRGFAAWSGRSGNYWGHNALIRVDAFREAARLPVLSGPAPFGGPLLSHDFVEAAWMRRAGWHVELEPDARGSAEDAPQTLEEFHKRDRRWCQGNLQHLRLIGAPGLHPVSRFHMISGVFSYLAAPVWLALMLMGATGAVTVESALPLILVALLLMVPKVCGLIEWFGRRMTPARLRTVLRAWGGEILLSAVIAPVMMVRQSLSVLSILIGRDCGWKSGRRSFTWGPRGGIEAAAGAALAAVAALADPAAVLWLSPVVLPLLAAPVLVRRLEA
jgi:membrane glycosyltransferase